MAITVRSLGRVLRRPVDYAVWTARGAPSPAPTGVKRAVLARYAFPEGQWIETGTYLGETTSWLARHYPFVRTIEPNRALAERATKKFSRRPNIQVLLGTSEERFADAFIESKHSPSLNLFLDGHFSGGVTFLGESTTPITTELNIVSSRLVSEQDLAVFIDDFRLFGEKSPSVEGYPPRDFLVKWAEEHEFSWLVEHDIFIARSAPLALGSS